MMDAAPRRPSAEFTREELYERVWSEPLSAVAANLGLSGNALAKICNRLLVPYPSRGHWARRGAPKARPPLPAAPEEVHSRFTISAHRAASRRTRTRLDPAVRREQLISVAEQIVVKQGVHAATLKQIASVSGISETQAYNYFGTREKMLAELARREFAKIRLARQEDLDRAPDHYARITLTTRTYLRQIAERGGLLQTLLSSPDVRTMLRKEHRKQHTTEVRAHAQGLVELFGIPRQVALACTVILTTLCLRAGKIISDKRVPLESGERLCLAMVVQGSKEVVQANRPQEEE
jgi:AcrR family transcriptional regulator